MTKEKAIFGIIGAGILAPVYKILSFGMVNVCRTYRFMNWRYIYEGSSSYGYGSNQR